MVARRTVVFRLYCATQLYTTVSSAIGMTKYCDSTDVSEDESTDYPESEHSDFTELQSSGISEDGSTDHPFSEYSETECSDFEDDVSIISHTDVDSDCWDDEKSCSATPLLEFDGLEEQKEHKDYLHVFPSSSAVPFVEFITQQEPKCSDLLFSSSNVTTVSEESPPQEHSNTPAVIETNLQEDRRQSNEATSALISTPLVESLPEEELTIDDRDVSVPVIYFSSQEPYNNSPSAALNEQHYQIGVFSPVHDVFSNCVDYGEFDFSTFLNDDLVADCCPSTTESSGDCFESSDYYQLRHAVPVLQDIQMSTYVPPSPPTKKRKQVEYSVNHSKRFKTENVEHYCVMYEGQPDLSSTLHRGVLYSEKLSKVFSSRCLFCQISKKACNSSPGNGKCDRCVNKSSQGEELCCIFNMKLYRKA